MVTDSRDNQDQINQMSQVNQVNQVGQMKQKNPICRFERDDCQTCEDGICMVLTDTDFSSSEEGCPFYRSVSDNLRESTSCLNRLIRIGRIDLIEKYQPIYMKLNLLSGEDDFIKESRAALEEKKQEIKEQVKSRVNEVEAISEEWYE